MGSKMGPKLVQKLSILVFIYGILFYNVLELFLWLLGALLGLMMASWGASGPQKPTKTEGFLRFLKMQLVCSLKLLMALLGSSCLPFRPIWPQNWLQNGPKNGPKMVPKRSPKKDPKNDEKCAQNGPQNGPKNGPKMGPKRSWGFLGSKTAPRQPKKAPRELQESLRQPLERPKRAPREPRELQESPREPRESSKRA